MHDALVKNLTRTSKRDLCLSPVTMHSDQCLTLAALVMFVMIEPAPAVGQPFAKCRAFHQCSPDASLVEDSNEPVRSASQARTTAQATASMGPSIVCALACARSASSRSIHDPISLDAQKFCEVEIHPRKNMALLVGNGVDPDQLLVRHCAPSDPKHNLGAELRRRGNRPFRKSHVPGTTGHPAMRAAAPSIAVKSRSPNGRGRPNR